MFNYELFSIGPYTFTAANLIGVMLVWACTWLILRLLRRMINRGRIFTDSDHGRKHSVFLLLQYVAWTIAAAAMLEVAGIRVSVFLAGSAALLVGLGLGVQQIFRDIMSGIFLLFEGTIEVGDVLQVDGHFGRVEEISLRTSRLLTRDGMVMIIPNHKFITENVTNWSHFESEPSRFSIQVGASYATDEQQMRTIMLEEAAKHPDVLARNEKYPLLVKMTDFAEERMVFELNFWTHRKFEVDRVASDLRFAIRQRCHAVGIKNGKG
jgi:small-conductance mechanosensitive channel